MAWNPEAAGAGAKWGTVLPGVGNIIGGIAGGLFGGRRSDKNNVAGKMAAWTQPSMNAFSGDYVLPPPTGEVPLAELPKYGGAGGSSQAAAHYAGQDFFAMFGRNPTQSELASLTPYYISGDANIANQTAGRQAVTQYFQYLSQMPENINAINERKWQADVPKYADTIQEMFKSNVGRGATKEELDYFGKLIASGQADPYTVGTYLQQLPEAVRKQDEEFRKGLSGELQTQDQQYYQEKVLPAIQQDFARRGRSVDSSGYASSLALAAQEQNRQRESFLSNLTAQQYLGNKQSAAEDYRANIARQYGLQDYGTARTNQLYDQATARRQELENFNIQRGAYEDYLRRYGKRNSGVGQLIGGLAGTGFGTLLGRSPQGAAVGYQIGSGFGSLFG